MSSAKVGVNQMIKKYYSIVYFSFGLLSCSDDSKHFKMDFLTNDIPGNVPIEFRPGEIPNDKLIHKGIFSPDLNEYYYTLSDKKFEQFDLFVQKREKNRWSKPEPAYVNSKYSDHGMCFSPDGNTLFFSSTRPTNINGLPDTWHIWKSIKEDGEWTTPVYVNIPNLTNKLISHPSVSSSGTMYFHSSNLDYSEMDIYYSKQINGEFEPAKKVSIGIDTLRGKCTPHISPNEDYLIFASIGGKELDLMITYKDDLGNWTNAKNLGEKINDKGQGNPYVTSNDKFLFFTAVDDSSAWKIMWVNIEAELKIY